MSTAEHPTSKVLWRGEVCWIQDALTELMIVTPRDPRRQPIIFEIQTGAHIQRCCLITEKDLLN